MTRIGLFDCVDELLRERIISLSQQIVGFFGDTRMKQE